MDAQEYEAWSSYMKSRKGTWTIDPIHDGEHRDLIAFISDPRDHTSGFYVGAHGATVEAGTYENGVPTMGDAMFRQRWGMSLLGVSRDGDVHGCGRPSPEVWKLIIERLGVGFLLGAVCSVPGR